ncbi:hypothetical protein B0H13DRAFT_1097709 [Mycena leptocephala]|nr:hypothetical protein B0H13DRAFT_1097709 [Mycena leptocephala]
MISGLFWRQFRALLLKNWIVFCRHPIVNLLRCIVLPVAIGIFLGESQGFLKRRGDYGLGEPAPVRSLKQEFRAGSLMWVDATDGNSHPSPSEIMASITTGFSTSQLNAVRKVSTPAEMVAQCPQNFRGFSTCYGGIVFNDLPRNNASTPINYTLIADYGFNRIDVSHHTGDFQTRVMPLQWAVDQAIIEIRTGVAVSTPLDWGFTMTTNAEQNVDDLDGLLPLLHLVFFLCFISIAYQVTGVMSGERASLVTSHMKAMGLLDSARIISIHVFFSLTYLPSWVILSVISHFKTWPHTNFWLLLLINVLCGLSLASWALFVAVPFGKSQLAAIVSTFLALILSVIVVQTPIEGTTACAVLTVIFPPMFYMFAVRTIDGFEGARIHTDATLLPLLVIAIINVFLYPYLTFLLERSMYQTEPSSGPWWRCCGKRTKPETTRAIDPTLAVSVQGLGKTFNSFFNRKSKQVTAIADLTINVPRSGIFVLLGSNGAGKSTFLDILGGLTRPSRGVVTFEGGASRPPPSTIGIVPQKNVLFPELSCLQTLRVWQAVKWSTHSVGNEDLEQLLRDCDLEHKIHANASTLSGGQKRKLQLAIGIVGGSRLLLVDECTSGVDPLSRRAIWRVLVSLRQKRTILLTTHLLDEADLLADHIAILAAPGKLVASDSPVALKKDLGKGYTVQATLVAPATDENGPLAELLRQIRAIAPNARMSLDSPQRPLFHLETQDPAVVGRVLALIDAQSAAYGIVSYDVLGATIEDIFLDVMTRSLGPVPAAPVSSAGSVEESVTRATSADELVPMTELHPGPQVHNTPAAILHLADGKPISPLRQSLTIFYKRVLIFRRSWLAPLLGIGIAVAGTVILVHPVQPAGDQPHSCAKAIRTFDASAEVFAPNSSVIFRNFSPDGTHQIPGGEPIFDSPPGIISTLGSSVSWLNISDLPNDAAFADNIRTNRSRLRNGGVSFDLTTGTSLFAWEGTGLGAQPGVMGMSMLNLVTNVALNRALNASGQATNPPTLIKPQIHRLPKPPKGNQNTALPWMIFFSIVMGIYPAFFTLYVVKERQSEVKTMQLSNGISNPMGLWLGHLMFDSISVLIVSTVVIILFAFLTPAFFGLGLLWLVMFLYGIAGILVAYCMSLVILSPLAAFGAMAAYQVITFALYIGGLMVVLTYATPDEADGLIQIVHFTLSLLSPVTSLTRAAILSVNLFSLLCKSEADDISALGLVRLSKFGGPILYLVVQSAIALTILFWVDSGSVLFQRLRRARQEIESPEIQRPSREDVDLEAATASEPQNLLQILDATKAYGSNTAVDNLTFGVAPDSVFCMVGPNGAGKTTSINMMSGNVIPDRGDVFINKASVVTDARKARISLGVCPQFSAVDAQLSVREHLVIYGRLKGLSGEVLRSSVDSLLLTTGLHLYTDRPASKLSGGNQRKLTLAIALIGNPPVVLIDEFSTGIDAKMKRELWGLLRSVAKSKAFVITTHSMEEAAALATKVGILAVRLLAVGTTEALTSRYATYEVHFTCRTEADVARAERLMAGISGARMVPDLATRFEVPSSNLALAELFRTLANEGDFPEYTVEKPTLESMFLKVIVENNVQSG